MELAFAGAEDGIFTLAEAGGDGAGDWPERGRVADVEARVEVGAEGAAASDSAGQGAGRVAADGAGAEGVEGVQRFVVAVV